MNLDLDHLNYGKIVVLKNLIQAKKDGADLNEIDFEESLEIAYRNFENPDVYTREFVFDKQDEKDINEISEELLEESK